MAGLSNLSNIWNTIKEVDLRPLRQEALNIFKIAIVGNPGSGRAALAGLIRRDLSQAGAVTQTPLFVLDLDSAAQAASADLVLLIVPAGEQEPVQEKRLERLWADSNKQVLTLVVGQMAQAGSSKTSWLDWSPKHVLYGSLEDEQFIQTRFVPAVIELVPDKLLSLGRHFPLFRPAIARKLIGDTSFSNAAYSISTGLAEIVPLFDIPLNVADIIVLTKAQAFLVYRLGLALGLSTQWQDYVAEFGGVLGGGFIWRQAARSLVGLIPAWGIIPKAAVAYAGTYVVGNVVLQWYLTGRHVSKEQMRQLYGQAFASGKKVAQAVIEKVPKPRLPKKEKGALPSPKRRKYVCPNCGQKNSRQAVFCQHCGERLGGAALPPGDLTQGS